MNAKDAQVVRNGQVFLCRVAAVAHDDGRLLLHRRVGDEYWAFPGGRLMVGETLESAVEREMHEETGLTVGASRLLWVVENFFTDQEKGTSGGPAIRHHELGFYFLVDFDDELRRRSQFRTSTSKGGVAQEFQWFSVPDVLEVDFRPRVLIDAIGDLSTPPQIFINRDD
ncbi:MAG: NUDIX hydrolase [Rhodothermia bacterium]